MKKKIFIVLSIIVFILIGTFYFFMKEKNSNDSILYKNKTVYTLDDFKNNDIEKADAEKMVQKINDNYDRLDKKIDNPYLRWIDIGLYKKTLGDIDGAENAWRNAVSLVNKPAIAYGNLANLYFYYKKDYKLAEEYYLKAIEISPNSYNYREALSDLYYYQFKEKANQIEGIINDGIKKEPMNKIPYYTYLIDMYTRDKNVIKRDEYIKKIKKINPDWKSDIQDIEL